MSMNTNQVLQDVTVEMTAEQEAYRKAEKRRFVIAVVIAILGDGISPFRRNPIRLEPCI